jgi:signal transduction histidine kinase
MIMDLDHGDGGEKNVGQVLQSQERLRELSSRLLNAQEEERKSLAHEVHENLAQSLIAVQFRVETALSEVKGVANPKIRELLEPVTAILQKGLRSIRGIAGRLRPMILDDLGILVTVSRVCREMAGGHPGLTIVERSEIEEWDIPEALKLVIFRILESALYSIVKQKPCGVFEVSLGRKGGAISLTIRDQAAGLGAEQVFFGDESHGRSDAPTIGERAMLSGGSIALVSNDGGGTTLRVSWPAEARR